MATMNLPEDSRTREPRVEIPTWLLAFLLDQFPEGLTFDAQEVKYWTDEAAQSALITHSVQDPWQIKIKYAKRGGTI